MMNADISLSESVMVESPSLGILVSVFISSSSDNGSPALGSIFVRASLKYDAHSTRVNGWYSSPLYEGTPASPGVKRGRVEVFGAEAEFRALGGNGIMGADDWAARDNGYSLSSLASFLPDDCGARDKGCSMSSPLAYLWGCLLARCGGGRLPLPAFLQ